MNITDRGQVNTLAEKREKLLALKTSLTPPTTVAVAINGRTVSDGVYLNTTRVAAIRAAILTHIIAEITDIETALAELDVQV